jgi:hypothetical protein
MEEQGVEARSLAHNTLGVEGRAGDRMGLGRMTSINYSHGLAQNQIQGG